MALSLPVSQHRGEAGWSNRAAWTWYKILNCRPLNHHSYVKLSVHGSREKRSYSLNTLISLIDFRSSAGGIRIRCPRLGHHIEVEIVSSSSSVEERTFLKVINFAHYKVHENEDDDQNVWINQRHRVPASGRIVEFTLCICRASSSPIRQLIKKTNQGTPPPPPPRPVQYVNGKLLSKMIERTL